MSGDGPAAQAGPRDASPSAAYERYKRHERRVLERLRGLPPRHRVAFAAACCERLVPLYTVFAVETGTGRPDELRRGLDAAWAVAAGWEQDDATVERLRQTCLELVEVAANVDTLWSGHADDAAAAVAYALACCRGGAPLDAALAARRVGERWMGISRR